jgi:hypothetical protein
VDTMATSDERREVAERLRVYSHDFDFGDSDPFCYVAKAVFGDVDVHTYYSVFARLADLIDPTCYLVDTTSTDGLHGPIIFSHELSCGHTCETFWREPPAHCTECGARVVDDE